MSWTQDLRLNFFGLGLPLNIIFNTEYSCQSNIEIKLLPPTNFIVAYDHWMNDVSFNGMKLAGLINICCGFVLVLTPANWADILRDLIRSEAN